MNTEILKSLLKNSTEKFTYKEIEALLNEELSKNEAEMDTQLIELCINALSYENSTETKNIEKNKKKKKVINFRRILLIASVFIIVIVYSFTVSADYFNVDADRKYVTVIGNNVFLHVSDAKAQNIFEKFKNKFYGDAYIPSAFLDGSCSLDVTTENSDILNMDFSFEESGIHGNIHAYKLSWASCLRENIQFFQKIEQVKQLNIDGCEVFVVAFTKPTVSVFYNTLDSINNINFFDANYDEVYDIITENDYFLK